MRSVLTESVLPRTMREDSFKDLLVEQRKFLKTHKAGQIISLGDNSFQFSELKKKHTRQNLLAKTSMSKTNPNVLKKSQSLISEDQGNRSVRDKSTGTSRTSTSSRTIGMDSNFYRSIFQRNEIYRDDRIVLEEEDSDVVEVDRLSYSKALIKRTSLATSCEYHSEDSEDDLTNTYQEYDTFEYDEYDNCVLSGRVNDFIVFEECISPAAVVFTKHTNKFGIMTDADVYVEQRASVLSCNSDSDILESVNQCQDSVNSILLNAVMNEISEFMDEIDLDSNSSSTCNDGSSYGAIVSGKYLQYRNLSESWATSIPDSDDVFSQYTSGISNELVSEIEASESWSEKSMSNCNICNENYVDCSFEVVGNLVFLRDYLNGKEAKKRKRWGIFIK
ncbi:hypothetical protein HK100_012176 [Physocladia obscura]|uniref:Uncharacterized protein n=1 Tax=Physocladia obscura TaxID=109957 RepID=A0AAD5T313_9FUNG|nr:hypothetical protein HK100_012176 [Physocladia obscura]